MAKHSTSQSVIGTRIALLTALLLASGCSRDVPSSWTSDSPASVEAHAVPAQDVTLSLDADPPLPGEAAAGWLGLEQTTAAPDHSGHAGHGGHAGHAEQPAESEPPEPAPEPAAKPKPTAKPKPAPQPKPDEHADHDEHAGHDMPEGAHHHGH